MGDPHDGPDPVAKWDPDRPLTVLVVDGQEVSRLGFRLLLGRQTWVERCLGTDDPQRAVELARHYDAHVAVVDAAIDAGRGVPLAKRLRAEVGGLQTLLINDGAQVDAALARFAGASGLISRTWPGERLVEAVRAAGSGAMPPDVVDGGGPLSGRERDVLRLIAAGATNPQIASELLLSMNTVKQHASNAYRKLEARNRTDAVRRAQELELL